MAITPDDLQPKKFKVKLGEREFDCFAPRLSHRLILTRVQPLFMSVAEAAKGKEVEIPSEKIIEYEKDLDVLFGELIPELKNVTLDIEHVMSLVSQIMDEMLPEESKELKDNKVKVGSESPKAKKTG